MKTLFTRQGKEEIIARINNHTPQSQTQWSKMNVSQMLAQAQKPVGVAIDTRTLVSSFMLKLMILLLGKAARKKLLKDEMFGRNSPIAPGFKITDQRDFEKEKQTLIDDINKFSKMEVAKKLGDRHPFFGQMTPEKWNVCSGNIWIII